MQFVSGVVDAWFEEDVLSRFQLAFGLTKALSCGEVKTDLESVRLLVNVIFLVS